MSRRVDTATHQPPTLPALTANVAARYPAFLSDLAALVAIDSGSGDAAGVNQVADLVADRLTDLGFTVGRTPVSAAAAGAPLGDVVHARRAGARPAAAGGKRIALVAHMDTVFDTGTAAVRPLTITAGIARGPGVCDDKGGLLTGILALGALADAGFDDHAEIRVVLTPDEEIGSPGSRPVTEALMADVDYALCLEGARADGDLVIARKGIVELRLVVTGRAAHAGIEPERGANAALEAAHLTVALQRLNGRWDGVTVNVGVLQAGSRPNIVAPDARLDVEIRSVTATGMAAARAAVDALAAAPTVEDVTVQVLQVDECPPMEDTPAAQGMLALARDIAAELGFGVEGAATGGVGDANLVAGLGVPTLDGLGPVGGDDHADTEWLDLASVVPRATLLAGLIARLGTGG